MNQIDGVCQTIEKTINQAVQKTLDQLEKDSDLICSTISTRLEKDRLVTLKLIYWDMKLLGVSLNKYLYPYTLCTNNVCAEEIKAYRILPAKER